MIPRNPPRHIMLVSFLGFMALGSAVPARPENALASPAVIQEYSKGFAFQNGTSLKCTNNRYPLDCCLLLTAY